MKQSRSERDEPKTAAELIGQWVRQIRQAAGKRQDEIALAARVGYGLAWTRATIAAIETGKRNLLAEEFALLFAALKTAGCKLDVDTERQRLLREVTEFRSNQRLREILAPGEERLKRVGSIWKRIWPETWKSAHATNRPSFKQIREVENDASGDAEQKAAAKLQVLPLAVAIAARRLWGKSLTQERDSRLLQEVSPNTDQKTLQALRGHVTRELLKQLEPLLEKPED